MTIAEILLELGKEDYFAPMRSDVITIATIAVGEFRFNPTAAGQSFVSFSLIWKHPHNDRVADIEVAADGTVEVFVGSPSKEVDVSWVVFDPELLPRSQRIVGENHRDLKSTLATIKKFLVFGELQ